MGLADGFCGSTIEKTMAPNNKQDPYTVLKPIDSPKNEKENKAAHIGCVEQSKLAVVGGTDRCPIDCAHVVKAVEKKPFHMMAKATQP